MRDVPSDPCLWQIPALKTIFQRYRCHTLPSSPSFSSCPAASLRRIPAKPFLLPYEDKTSKWFGVSLSIPWLSLVHTGGKARGVLVGRGWRQQPQRQNCGFKSQALCRSKREEIKPTDAEPPYVTVQDVSLHCIRKNNQLINFLKKR